MTNIAIIDYGMGNLRSVLKALEQVAPQARIHITQQRRDILQADRVVFPGQGSIRDCLRELRHWDLIEVVQEAARSKPFLGLCLGPQALLDFSEENGGIECLGILPGQVRRFNMQRDPNSGERLKVPHMGWNRVQQTQPHALWSGIAQDSYFYFVHSYFLQPADAALVVGTTDYGAPFASVLARDNIFAVQFHPEKSAQTGLRLLANFAAWQP